MESNLLRINSPQPKDWETITDHAEDAHMTLTLAFGPQPAEEILNVLRDNGFLVVEAVVA